MQVHEDGGCGAVLENVRTRECVWLAGEVSEIAVQIIGWLDDPEHPGAGSAGEPHPQEA